jgi:hypothetical protein
MPASQQNPSLGFLFAKAGARMGTQLRSPALIFQGTHGGPNDANTSRLPYYDPSLRCVLALWVVWLDEVAIATITCPPTFSATAVEGFRCHGVLAVADC